jgi:hypothetical protein
MFKVKIFRIDSKYKFYFDWFCILAPTIYNLFQHGFKLQKTKITINFIIAVKAQPLKVKLGGGEKTHWKLHAEGKMTARERIDYLLDQKQKQ